MSFDIEPDHDEHVECRREIDRLQEQRDRAWRALAEIEGMITPGDLRLLDLAMSLAGSRGPDDCDEWNMVMGEAAEAEGDGK